MPRKPDSALEERILNAAYDLWTQGGEQALTMRAVARGAGTTTPTIYERFRGKRELLAALQARAQRSLFNAVEPGKSIREAWTLAIEFTLAHSHEYELLAKSWAARLSRKQPTPTFDLLKTRLAEQFGGTPEDHMQFALGVVALYHGASMLLLGEGIDPQTATAIKQAAIAAVDSLVATAGKRKRPGRAAD
jgi:AcrR family transcriptional regulator